MVQFASYLRRVLCKTRLIFPRINGPIMISLIYSEYVTLRSIDGRRREAYAVQNVLHRDQNKPFLSSLAPVA